MSSWMREAGRPELGAGVRGSLLENFRPLQGTMALDLLSPPPQGLVTGLVRGRDQLQVYLTPRPLLSYQPTQPSSRLSPCTPSTPLLH